MMFRRITEKQNKDKIKAFWDKRNDNNKKKRQNSKGKKKNL